MASAVARAGVAFVHQEANVFRALTVLENLPMGAWTSPSRRTERMERVFAMFPALGERKRQSAENLSGGERQMVALGMVSMPRTSARGRLSAAARMAFAGAGHLAAIQRN